MLEFEHAYNDLLDFHTALNLEYSSEEVTLEVCDFDHNCKYNKK